MPLFLYALDDLKEITGFTKTPNTENQTAGCDGCHGFDPVREGSTEVPLRERTRFKANACCKSE